MITYDESGSRFRKQAFHRAWTQPKAESAASASVARKPSPSVVSVSDRAFGRFSSRTAPGLFTLSVAQQSEQPVSRQKIPVLDPPVAIQKTPRQRTGHPLKLSS